MDTLNKYLLKAIESYDYNLEETVESLNYALSYEPENAQALRLMGKVHLEYLHEYDLAAQYYGEAIASNMDLVQAYTEYARVLILKEDYVHAMRVISYAITIKGTNKAVLYMLYAGVLEELGNYKLALKVLDQAYLRTYNNEFTYQLDFTTSRIKEKIKRIQPKKQTDSKAKKTKNKTKKSRKKSKKK